jgi:hypothetical protein
MKFVAEDKLNMLSSYDKTTLLILIVMRATFLKLYAIFGVFSLRKHTITMAMWYVQKVEKEK